MDTHQQQPATGETPIPIPLPFYLNKSLLPAPLPNIEEIADSTNFLQDYPRNRVVRVGIHFIVKYGGSVSFREGENMLFIKQSTTVPVPTIYAMYSRRQGEEVPINYIVMEFIPGTCLRDEWASLDESSKLAVTGQLRGLFSELRQIPSPGYYGIIGRRPFEDHVFCSCWDDRPPVPAGPFTSEAQVLDALAQKYSHHWPEHGKGAFYKRVLPLVLRNHPPVFTHGDLQRKNVVVRDDGKVVLIDWEAAGWYPSFWEYSMAMFACDFKDDWQLWLGKVIDECLSECSWMLMLWREIYS